jgi:hypothetical protein
LSGEPSAKPLLIRPTLSGETAADIYFVYLWLTRPKPTHCYNLLCPAVLAVLRTIRLSSPLQPTLSSETIAHSMLLSSLSVGPTYNRLSSTLRSTLSSKTTAHSLLYLLRSIMCVVMRYTVFYLARQH